MSECKCQEWIPTETVVDRNDWSGHPIKLTVKAESCPTCGEIRIDADAISIAEQKCIAETYKLTPEEMTILLFLYSPGPRFTDPGFIEEKYRFNKMLFYFWKGLSENGFGNSLVHDVFESDKRGPVPKNLKDFSKSLEQKGLVKMQWGGKREKKPYRWDLTAKGKKLSEELWNKTPDIYKKKIQEVKKDLFLLDRTELMDKVHREYPEYRATYTTEDAE